MKRFITVKAIIILLILYSVLFISCEARIDGSLAADGSASLNVNMSLYPRMASLIQRMSAIGEHEEQILNGPEIARSMVSAPGIASVVLRNTSSSALNGQVRISQISDFLSAGMNTEAGASGEVSRGQMGFITFERRGAGGRVEININLSNGHIILALLSPQISDYLTALMAPIVTNERSTKTEYLDLVTTVYNRSITDEIARSTINVSIEFPGRVISATGGTFTGRRVVFNIPLIDLLVLETPLRYEVAWN